MDHGRWCGEVVTRAVDRYGGECVLWWRAAMSNIVMHNSTYEDLMRERKHRVAEIIDGTLYSMLRPAFPHARTSSMLGAIRAHA